MTVLFKDELEFIKESNRIEGIYRAPTKAEKAEFRRFMSLDKITIADMKKFVSVYAGKEHVLRDKKGLDVRVGKYYPPEGSPDILVKLQKILDTRNNFKTHVQYFLLNDGVKIKSAKPINEVAYKTHIAYEQLHPFTDGNGRSGRILWLWVMKAIRSSREINSFLHQFYYQTLQREQKQFW